MSNKDSHPGRGHLDQVDQGIPDHWRGAEQVETENNRALPEGEAQNKKNTLNNLHPY